MKKSILNLGKALNKSEQKKVNGGYGNCPQNCEYFSDTVISSSFLTSCGRCSEYYQLPTSCRMNYLTSCRGGVL